MYMNKTKRNLILASAIVNLIGVTASFVFALLIHFNVPGLEPYVEYIAMINYSVFNLVYSIIAFVVGVVGSALLMWSVRNKGKYYRTSQGFYVAGFIIIVISGGWLSWVLLFIAMFVPDVIVMNSRSEIRHEEREEEKQTIKDDAAYEEKKKRIEDLKRMRDNGIITEEEYKQKLFDLL